MKILIITFTRGSNPGTFLQAYGVQTAMKQLYPKAIIEYLSFPDFKQNFGTLLVHGKNDNIIKFILQKAYSYIRLKKYDALRSKTMLYSSRTIDLFNYPESDIRFFKSYDLVVIGSDTILEEVYNKKGRIGLNWMPLEIKKIYFAASASPARFELPKSLKEIVLRANYIGLRDDLTIDLFNERMGIDLKLITKQPDATYYLDISQFKLSAKYVKRLKYGRRYCLCNFMSNFPLKFEVANKLRDYGYTIVATQYASYADICLPLLNAFEWAGVFPLINLVVTERFHDSVFALRNCKPVIAFDWDSKRFDKKGNSKTSGILSDYDMSEYHLNLADRSNLAVLDNIIKEVLPTFDIKKVDKYNKSIINLNDKILRKIKQATINN